MLDRPAVVVVYVRHRGACQHADKGEFYQKCDCVKWLRYTKDGKQHRVSAATRAWGPAEEQREELQGRLDAGDPLSTPLRRTIAVEIETFLMSKRDEGVSPSTLRRLRFQLGKLERFMSGRSKSYASEITPADILEFRASWTWGSVTRQKAQQNLRGFLRLACGDNLKALLDVLKPIKLTKTDHARLQPKPFSEAELARLLAQVPKTFDATKAARMTAFIHCQVSTGLAIRDVVQLERANIQDGWLRIRRQKTNKAVVQKLDDGLYQELLRVTNGNERYIFWDGKSLPTSATGLWQADLRELMQAAGVWVKGNLSHRFRDTAVDYWLSQGVSMTQVAGLLADTVRIVEHHYADLASKRQADRLALVPTRSWDAGIETGRG